MQETRLSKKKDGIEVTAQNKAEIRSEINERGRWTNEKEPKSLCQLLILDKDTGVEWRVTISFDTIFKMFEDMLIVEFRNEIDRIKMLAAQGRLNEFTRSCLEEKVLRLLLLVDKFYGDVREVMKTYERESIISRGDQHQQNSISNIISYTVS